MRTKPVLLALLVALAAVTVLATTAAAAPGRLRLYAPTTTTSATKPVPAADLVPKTTASIPGAGYPWVQPIWQTVDGVVVVTLPRTIATTTTQPPAWVLSR